MAKIVVERKRETTHLLDHVQKHKEISSGFMKAMLAGSRFCPVCGEKLETEAMVNSEYCSNCGERLFPGLGGFKYRYCPNCGEKFED
jgi:NADH pyrophosphatase NudC (nudix superfamily)